VAEDETGKPAVEAALGHQIGDGEVGSHQMGHYVLARWRLGTEGGGAEPKGEEHADE
jgi:hypothetical protein